MIAYIIEPWVKWNQQMLHLKNHTLAVVLTTFEGVLFTAVLCLIFIPLVEREFSQLGILLDRYIKDGHPALERFPTNVHLFIQSHLNINKIIEGIERINTTEALESIWRDVTSGLDKILGFLGWLISIVYVIFILLDFEKYKRGIKSLIPNKYMGSVMEIGHDVSWSMKRYFRNQALISFITGLLYVIGFSIVGIPMAVVIGLINMVLFMVPYLVYVSLIPVTIMCAFKSMESGMDFWGIWFECLAVYAIVEMISDLLLTPRIMGKALGMNPALILLSLSVWGSLLGLLGMVIALPVTTILIKWFKIWLVNWKNGVNNSSA